MATDFRKFVRKEMKRSKTSIYRLAIDTEINYKTIHNFLSGKTSIGSDYLERIINQLQNYKTKKIF